LVLPELVIVNEIFLRREGVCLFRRVFSLECLARQKNRKQCGLYFDKVRTLFWIGVYFIEHKRLITLFEISIIFKKPAQQRKNGGRINKKSPFRLTRGGGMAIIIMPNFAQGVLRLFARCLLCVP